ncbi:hypothetical protein MMC11_005710 [Xylographa trunciseda]|nr:hypothetical protein [Xylographa trunciseda]
MIQISNPPIENEDEVVDTIQIEDAIGDASLTASIVDPSTLISSSHLTTDQTSTFDSNDDEARSETSYGSSVKSDASHSIRIPPPPKASTNGRPFECQYCYKMITIRDAGSWRKHVYSDLLPYICTFESCTMKMFAERHTWSEHELNIHRREWCCVLCSHSSQEEASFRDHLNMRHHELCTEAQLPFIMTKCELSIQSISRTACPFCDSWTGPIPDLQIPSTASPTEDTNIVSLKQFYRHVGRHMEDLALFVLPQRYSPGYSSSADSDDSSDDSDPDSDSDAKALIISKRDRQGRTALARACAAERIDEVWRLIRESPQDLDVPDHAGNTPLQIASGVGSDEIVQILIDSGCSTKCRNKVWNTPLMDAAMNGHSMVVFKLMAAGVSLMEHNADGKVALDMLDPTVPDYETIKAALTYGGTDTTQKATAPIELPLDNGWESDEGDTPLNRDFIIAVGRGTEEEALELLEKGANPDVKHYRDLRFRIRALDLAAMVNRPAMIFLLLRHGADIKLVDPGLPVILVMANFVEPLRVLLENGLDINITWTGWVETALSCAADRNQVETVRMLLAFNADPNKEIAKKPEYQLWPSGRPPLSCAAANGNEELVELLLAAGADIQMPSVSNRGFTPLHHAAATGQPHMIRLLVRHGADIEAANYDDVTPILTAITYHRESAFLELVSLGACIHAQNERRTPSALAMAASEGQVPIIRHLLSVGADIDFLEREVGTPLHWAAWKEYKGTLEVLLHMGADTHIKNEHGETALDIVIRQGRTDLAELWVSCATDGRSTTVSNTSPA